MRIYAIIVIDENGLPVDFEVFRALAVPARVELLALLLQERGSARVGELAARMKIDPSGVSRHLRELELAGVVRSERRGRERIFTIQIDDMIQLFESLVGQLKRAKKGLQCC